MKISKPLRNFFAATTLAGAASLSSVGLAQEDAPTAAPLEHDSFVEVMQATGMPAQDIQEYDKILKSIVVAISRNYVDPVKANPTDVYFNMLKGMNEKLNNNPQAGIEEIFESGFDTALSALDPHSDYFNEQEWENMTSRMSANFAGLGIRTSKADESAPIVVEGLMDDDVPAAKAGLEEGDRITHIDGTAVEGMTAEEASELMKGQKGSPVDLTVERNGHSTPLSITVIRDIIEVSPVESSVIDNDVGYIRLSSFTANADAKMDEAIEDIQKSTNGNVSSYILDLRFNGGGRLDQAAEIVDNFIHSGTIVSSRNSKGEGQRYVAEPGDMINGKPLVILVNGYSASASEIVSGTLQDVGRAKIVGGQTFGKGSVQALWPMKLFDKRSGLKLTTALYYTANDRSIQNVGVTPDVKTAFTLVAKHSESKYGNTIANPTGQGNTPVKAQQYCDVNPANTDPDPATLNPDYVFQSRDGKTHIDYDLMCAVQTLKGNNPYVQVKNQNDNKPQQQTATRPAFGA